MNTTCQPAAIAISPVRINLHMLAVLAKAGIVVRQGEAERRRAALQAGLNLWAAQNQLALYWTAQPGHRTKGREYRVVDIEGLVELQAVLDRFDVEIEQTILGWKP